jgi:uracil DNA glycosylase
MTRLNWDKFADAFHPSWEPKMRPFIEGDECWAIYEQIRARTGKGKMVVPAYQQTYRAFKETGLDNIKCMFMGLAPYHTLKDKRVIADGLN